MAVGRRKLAPLWALAFALACTRHPGQAQQGSLQPGREPSADLSPLPGHSGDPLLRTTVTPPLNTIPVVQAPNPAHNGRVCSTWGDSHYKTFDGDIFRFPGLCNYVFSAHCGAAYEDFNVQLRRSRAANTTTLSRVIMKLDGLVIELNESSVLVNGHPIQLPFSQSGVLMERSHGNLKVTARLGLVFMWDQDDDSLLLELDSKFANQTCGLCGDFNGIPVFNEFFSHDVRLTPMEFGNLQKMDGPTEQCQDPDPAPQNCSISSGICEELLRGQLFSGCAALVDVSSYVEACRQDLCLCEQADLPSCICHTLAEYSRQCAHAGGLPQDWRGPDLCYQTCPLNLQHQECGSPCTDTCSNPQRSQLCEDHCVAGCFCPEGTVFDDIGQTGCVPMSQCSCMYNGTSYAPGASYSTDCTRTCSGGRWSCQEVPCQGTCSVLGGSHLSTFDEKQYTVHGDCSYVLTKPCHDDAFTVLAELRRCGLTESETCLKGVELRLGGGPTAVVVKASGEVFVNQIYTQLPVSTANVTLFRPSTFFIIAQTHLGVQLAIQLVPTMQVFVRLAPELRGLTCGLCGNFNSIQADDFRTNSGVVEGTGAAFANTWKTQAACPNAKSSFEDPCSLSVENEKYAQHWCSQLTSPDGPFAQCHATVSPSTYYSNCMFDTCNCEKSEDCMCAALSSYVQACAAKGVLLRDWRAGVCTKPTTTCPKSMTYHYHISTCQPTCRALSEEDVTCDVSFVPVDGCACPEGTLLDASDKCVPAASCPCYHRGSMVPNGESLHDSGAVCTCTQGTLTCIGGPAPTQVCDAPMVYFDCHNATHGATGAGCQKSCHTLDMACYSPQCEPGCVCPPGLVADGSGGCIAAEDCPCMHNGASYRPGETIWAGCNTCTCENRMWRCTEEPCQATCALYGDGHFLTFDGQRYTFSGDCQYTLVQDHCGGNGSAKDAFRVVTENVPCGTTGTTCSKDIKIFLGSYELKLSSGKVEVVQKGAGQEPPYTIRQMGIYLVVDTDAGLVLLWDRRTSIFLRLSPEFKGRVCGLCGNFDGNALNDFTTRSQAVVGDALEFGNSWKLSPSCPDAPVPKDPCTTNPYRKAWAQKQCSIIHSATFATCHAHVEPTMYYEACVGDACACDSGGDCECFCTAVAAYAQACHEAGVCVSWRTPDVCPLFCDYYNPQGECEWHFQPCGAPCLRTCRNPSGRCLHDLRGLEGCYPKCPPSAPIFDEDKMQCVDKCPTPTPPPPCRIHGKSYRPGATVPSDKNCYSCICTENGVHCAYDSGACVCTYDGRHFHPGDVIYHTSDGMGSCISAHCRANGTVERRVFSCSPTTPRPPTTFSFSTSPHTFSSRQTTGVGPSPTQSTVHPVPVSTASSTATGTPLRTTPATPPVSSSVHCGEKCLWSPWLDVSRPGQGVDSGDFDTLQNLRAHGFRVCQAPRAVECRAEDAPEVPLQALGQSLECSPTAGLTCHNRDQASGLCHNYQIRVLCCSPLPCPTSSPPARHRTTNTVPTTSATVSSTPVRTSFLKSSPTPRPKTTSGTSSASASPPGTSQVTSVPTTSGVSPVSCLRESCTWTHWMDGSYPGPGRDSGDFDTFHNLRSKGYKFCERPTSVECRAQFFPNTPLAELGQQVTCNSEEGLICWNRDQLPPICYNYEIRIQCCELVDDCRNKTVGTPKSIATHPKSPEGSTTRKTTVTTGSQATSTGHTTHPTPVHTSRGTSVGTKVTQPQTTDCQPQCTWTKWFDVDFPDPGPHGGDTETYSNILSKGERICLQPEDITRLECRAENHPEVSIEALGQVVQCEPDLGLVCRNQEQQGPLRMCLNYEVRVLCCHTPDGCPTTVPVTHSSTSRETLTSQVLKTDSALTDSPSSTREISTTSVHTVSPSSTGETSSTPVHTVSPSSTGETSSTSVHTVSPSSTGETSSTSVPTVNPSSTGETSSTPVHTVSPSSTGETSSTSVHTVRPSSSGETSSTSVHTVSPSSRQKTSSTSVPTVSPSSTGKTSSTSVPTSSSSHTPAPESTHSTPQTTDCQPQCTWTKWFDVDFPDPGPHGGDTETYSNILSKGERICLQPEDITRLECRAENHPEVSIEALGQVVQCEPDLGLVCRNQEQQGPLRMCLNYEVRVLCCHTPDGCPTTVPVTHSSTSRETLTSQVLKTDSALTDSPSSIPVHTVSPSSTRETSSTPVHTVSPSSTRETSSTSVHTVSPSSTRETSSTSVPTVSPSSTGETSSTSVPTVSPSSTGETSSTSVHTVSPSSMEKTSSTSVHTVSPSSTGKTSSTSVHKVSPSSTRETSSTSVHTVSPSSTGKTSSTSVHTVSPSSRQKTSSTSVPTVSPSSTEKTSSTSVHTVSPSSTRETSSTSVHTVSPSSTRETSSTSVHKLSPSSTRETSSTPVHTVSPSSTGKTSSTPVHTVSPSSTGKTSSTSVHTVSPSSTGKTSSTSVHTVSPSSTRETSSTPVPTVSPSSTGKTSSTPVPTVSPSSTGKTSSTSVHSVSPSSTRETSSTSVHTVSPSSTGKTSSTSVPTVSPSSRQKTSSTSVPTVSPSSTRETSSTPVHTVSPSSRQKTSSTSVHTVSPSSTEKTSSTSVHTVSPSSTRETSSTPVPTVSPSSTEKTSSTSVHTVSPSSRQKTSSTSVPTVSPSSTEKTSSTSVHTVSPSSRQKTSSTSVPTVSPSSMEKTSSTPVHTVSPSSRQKTSSTSVPTVSPSSTEKTSSTPVHTVSPSSTGETSSTSVHTVSPSSTRETSSTSVHKLSPSSTGKTSSTSVHTVSPSSTGKTSSTPVPTSSSSHTPAPESTHSTPQTTDCQPQCTWTKWFDVDFPDPGPHGGDTETYSNILSKGERICLQPEDITRLECRAENHPEVSIEALGQVVQCEPDLGLVCRNQEQQGPLRMCLNYEVRVLCCHTPDGCPTKVPVTHSSTTRETLTSQVQKTDSALTDSPSSTREISTTSVHIVSPSSTPETSSTSVPTVSPSSTRETSSTSVPTVSPSSTGKTSSTSVHTVSPSSTGKTSSTPVHTVSPSSTGETSSTSVHTVSPSSTRETSSTSVPTVSPSSTGKTSSTSVHTVSPSSTGETSSTSVHTVSRSSTRETSSTSVHTVSPSSTRETSSTSVHTVSPSSTRETSSTSVHTVSPSSRQKTSSTSVPTVSPSSTGKTSSTPVPTSSSSHTPAPESTHSTPQTTDCQPQCTWTKWFDVDFPDPGPHGGDTETYSNILSKGERICLQPEDITRLECRAENHPEVSIEALGQVVQCEPDLGLVCRNQEQQGPLRMCLNYEVRVLCCHTPDGCPTTGTAPWTAPPEPSSSVPSTSAVSSPWSPSSAPSSTLPCFCSVLDQLYPAGSIIYRQRDLSGHCYYAVCSQDCEVIKGVDDDCPSTTPPPTSVSSLSMSTPETGCPNMHPPREKGETWPMPNCTQATCEGNSIISLRPRQCPEVKEPTCANGYPALKVADQDGCCQHYQCQCVCSGWGDPHYITFDGTYYTFLDNCTYVLVQQVVPVFGHFRVLINNDFCDPKDQLSCPQAIIVEYHQDRVVLTRTPVGGVMTNQIIFNNKVVSPGFQSNGIAVSRVGIKMYVTIREIGVQVMFSGLIFSVEVPFSTFANNTEGQCGTCTNDKRDECRLPGGTVAPSCSAMSGHWKVDVPGQPHCQGPPPTAPSTTPQTTPVQCPPSPLCELILSKVFQPCHHIISPQSFYEGCVFDYCHMTPPDVVCSGLQLYAALCASEGVCIDWRGHTDQACPFPCSAGKVYLPCGPSSLPYCYGKDSTSSLALQEAGPITEGCFCPEDTMLFSSDAQVCVPANCSWCLGPHGEPVEPGHTISTDCQECTCQDSSQNLTCHRKPCPLPPACPLPGFVPVPTAPKAGQCCPQFVCACNTSYCPEPQHCPKGSRLVLTHEEGACCPSQICRGIGCNVNGTVYQPGAVVSSSLCERCWCEAAGSPPSDSFLVSCETQICNTHCPLGFEYQAQRGQCCGKCVAVSCVVNTSRGRDHFLHPGESWSDPENRCVTYRCEKHQDRLEVVTVEKQCAALSCARDQARLSSDGCCFVCPHKSCRLHHRNQTIRQGSCSSAGPVRLSYCQGNCGSSTSLYSLDTYTVERKCQCCQELRTSRKKVSLTCADGSSRTFSYTQAEACGCLGQQCHSPGDTSHSGSSESESKKSKEQSQESESSS
ncbi:mucin-5AC [Urocitellus parryii]